MNKKTKKIINAIAMAAAGIAMSFASITDASAQVFENTGGTYTGAAGSKIRMLGGCSTTTPETSANITGLGSSTTPIPGTVEWARNGNQTVPDGLYFTNLLLGNSKSSWTPNGNRTINNTNVYGVYSSIIALNNITYAAGTTFTYSGANQSILGTGNKAYANLALTTGAKTITNVTGGTGGVAITGGAVSVNTALTTTTGATVNISTVPLKITGGTGSSIATNISVDAGGEFAISGTGTEVAIAATTGAVALSTNTSRLTMDPGTTLNVAGALTTVAGNDGNINFDHSANPATVDYASGTTVMPVGDVGTAATGSAYGRLRIGPGVNMPGGDVYVAGDVADALDVTTGGNINTLKSSATFGSTNANDYNRIIFTRNPNTGMSGAGEVTGIVAKNTFASSTAYSFNNAATKFTAGAAITNGSGDGDLIGFFVVPGAKVHTGTVGKHNWTGANPGGVADRYVELINTHGSDYTVSNLTIGYSEGFTKFDNSAHTIVTGKTRTFEGISSGIDAVPVKSVSDPTGGLTAYDFGTITTLQNSSGAGTGNLYAKAGNTFLLTNGVQAIFTATRNGRWSDPQTWSAGMQPGSEDIVTIPNNIKIWTGDGAGYLSGGTGTPRVWDVAENISGLSMSGGAYILAAEVKILDGGGLFIGHVTGSSANNGTYSFGHVIINNNTTANTFTYDGALSSTGTSASGLNGLFISSYSLTAETNVFRASTLTNNGTITNNGILEIGCGD